MGPGDFIIPYMKPLIEVCVYVPWGREIMTRKCYDKEIPWHWNDGINGLLAPLSGGPYPRRTRGCSFGTAPRPVGNLS